ncbi:hypothetical protein [Rubellimicrobium roseum]|uniref:Uncharacterized protein n=1 Tax=Rubellimicrobium roseum TaxID=687525 RepID=A0A5C4N543_9RHOB|nr:hypothetical protein [Rubellimicrobium roseum]TNC63986.1 hypothetical protein FHG71_18785 [Rubellimicrobium roseum]
MLNFSYLRRHDLSLALTLALLGSGAQAQVTERTGLFAESERATASADVAIDNVGALHMGYVHWEPEVEGAEAVYATCAGGAAACASFEAWSTVELIPAASRVQVAVTVDGRPRLLIVSTSQTQGGGYDYSYAECNAGCTDRANWTVTPIAMSWDNSMSAIMADRTPQRTFLLDAEGRPQFLYSDRNYFVEPDHYGTFWMTCKVDCTDRANWTETDIAHHSEYDTEIFDAPALTLTPDGRPRIVSRIFAIGENGEDAPEGLYYLTCDTSCTHSTSWQRVWLAQAGSGSYPSPSWDLEIDFQGRPRIAFFAGDGMEPADLSHTLIYLWCDGSDCLSSVEAWTGTVVVGEGHGEMVDLELTPEGHPRMAFRTNGGELAFSTCDTACETQDQAVWASNLIEGQGDLANERPTALPFTCDGEVWEGIGPQLLLPADDRPLVAYDVSVEGRCLYEDYQQPNEVFYDFHGLWRGARIVSFAP